MGDTPVPIPNTMVKTQAADDTALETVWESRWLPGYQKNKQRDLFHIYTDMSLVSGMATTARKKRCVNPNSREVLLTITGFTSDLRSEESSGFK